MGVGMEDGPEGPPLPPEALHGIELFPGLHLVANRGVKGIGDGNNGDRLSFGIRGHKTAGLFRPDRLAMVQNLLGQGGREADLRPQVAGT